MIERNKKKEFAVHMIGTRWHFLIISRSTIGNELKFFFSSLFHQNQGERSLRYFPLDRHIRTPFYSVHHNAELEKRIALSQLAQILELNCRS